MQVYFNYTNYNGNKLRQRNYTVLLSVGKQAVFVFLGFLIYENGVQLYNLRVEQMFDRVLNKCSLLI